MTVSLFPFHRIRATSQQFVVESADEPAALLPLLERDRLYAAYALAQLEPAALPLSAWWTCETAAGLSLVCHSRGGLGDALFALGPADGVEAIFSIHPGAFQSFATAKPEHIPALRSAYRLRGSRTMLRLHVTAESFRPVTSDAVRFGREQVEAVNRLYGSEGGSTSYQGRHISEGCYCGVVVEGRLVAVAGTHAISRGHGIAVLGNVFTHPSYRGRGYATRATSAVTQALLSECRDVVLSVDPSNGPAREAYGALGYRETGDIVETTSRRRISGLMSGWRRALAAFRGRRRGAEIVWLSSR